MKMTLYEIDEAIYNCINDETGEVDQEKFEKLQGIRTKKMEGAALGYKNLTALATAMKIEEDKLKARRKAVEKRAEGLKMFLSMSLNGEEVLTPLVKISWRKSEAVVITDEKSIPEQYWNKPKPTAPTVNKSEISKAINNGVSVPGASLVERQNIQIN